MAIKIIISFMINGVGRKTAFSTATVPENAFSTAPENVF